MVKLTLSANAGVAVDICGKRIWVDALHTARQPGFSCVDEDLQKKMLIHEAFQKPDVICYTHCHPDHYSGELTKVAGRIWPQARVILPGTVAKDTDKQTIALEDVTITFLRLPHEGAQYADTLHFGISIKGGGRNVLLTGDCAVGCDALRGLDVDICVVDFPWISLPKGRRELEQGIRPRKIVACHIPFAQDDINGYREAAAKAAQQMNHVYLLQEPLQSIEL